MTFPLGTLGCDQPPCSDAVYLGYSYFLDLWDRLYPVHYLETLKSPGPGYEILQAYARVFARISLAAARLDCGAHIVDSFGGTLSNGEVQFTRPNAAAGDLTIRAGTVVGTSRGGRRYVTATDVSFTGGSVGPITVAVAAVRPDWYYNARGHRTGADGTVFRGDVDQIVTLDAFLSPSGDRYFNDPPISVDNEMDICGGLQPMLDGLGADRGLTRGSGETDAAYKNRIRTLPNTVSPVAIEAAVAAFFLPYGLGADVIETWDPAYQTCYDITGTEPNIDPNLFCYDDPRPAWPPFRNRWLGEEDFRGAFIVVVPNLGAVSDVGMAWDDTATGPTAVSPDTQGLRAIAAWDVDPTTPVLQGGYDGFDLGKQGIYLSLYELLDRIKAAGVYFAIELRGQ